MHELTNYLLDGKNMFKVNERSTMKIKLLIGGAALLTTATAVACCCGWL